MLPGSAFPLALLNLIVAAEVQKLTGSLWTIFKTLLFTSVMITQSVLSAVLYTAPPTVPSSESKAREDDHSPLASTVALSVLQIFSNLSFVISQFGGVTSQTEGGFTELRRTFYTALDVLSADVDASETYVRQMASREGRLAIFPPSPLALNSDIHSVIKSVTKFELQRFVDRRPNSPYPELETGVGPGLH